MAKIRNKKRKPSSDKSIHRKRNPKNLQSVNKLETVKSRNRKISDLTESVNLFPIVGIGASAGGLEAIRELLRALPADTGMAFILVQHLDPSHGSLAPDILSRDTQMPVHEVKEGMRVERDHVYLIPPNSDMELLHGVLNLLPLDTGTRGQRQVIDLFLQSLAIAQKDAAIGVILSGTASDGTAGLRAIKKNGGLTISQDPKTAKYSGMPESAIASGFVDLILSPIEIAKELARIARHPFNPTIEGEDGVESASTGALRKIFLLLRMNMQVDFSNYKYSTILRRIDRRMIVQKCENIDVYAQLLKENPNEIQALFSDILIHVTEFFRDPDSFEAITAIIFPKILKGRSVNKPIRIWVPGCSTGEEAYSIAMLLIEFLNKSGAKIPIQIFATCIGDQVIQKARAGIYSKEIEKAVSKERLEHFFEKFDDGYKINKSVRDLCLFSKHDVTRDPPFSKLDFVSCRNVLIYFSPELQKRVIPLFHYSLNPGGFLFLGKSESIGAFSSLFLIVDKTHKIFSKVNVQTPMVLRLPTVYEPDEKRTSPKAIENLVDGGGFQKDTERIALSRYAPPSVTVNANMEILQYTGRTAPCIEPSSGLASNNLFKMARQELLQGLRTAMRSSISRNMSSRLEGISFKVDGRRRIFNIEVVPSNKSAQVKQRTYVVFFEELTDMSSLVPQPSTVAKKGRRKPISAKENQENVELEKELEAVKDSYKAMTEEFETAQEELTSANEELQSANEELQSTNEELETSKEELQSSNEELTTVNDELQNRNAELILLSSDLNNVLTNVEIPIVIVGSDLRIRKFTPIAEKIFNLISSDVGRPLSNIKPNFESDLASMVALAIKSLSSQESEIRVNNTWMRLQVRPYRTIDDRIEGAVVTLVDITALKMSLAESQNALQYATSVADTLHLPLVVLDKNLHLLSANAGFADMFKIVSNKDIGSDLMSVLGGVGWSIPSLRKLLVEVISENKELKDFQVDHNFPELGHRIMLLNARRIKWQDTMPSALLLSIDDITEKKTLELSLEHSEERFRRVVESAHDAIIIVDSKGIIEFANQRTFRYFGYDLGELEGKALEILIPERNRKAHTGYHKSYMAAPNSRPMGASLELFGLRKDGSEVPVDISLTPIRTGSETKVTAIIRDISETKKLSSERKILLEQEKAARAMADRAKADAEIANATKDVFLATLSHELRTPLSSILSWAQLIQTGSLDPQKLKHAMQTIEQSAKTQGQLIDDLLDVARIQSGKLSINFKDVDPKDSIKRAISTIRAIAEKKHIVIESEIKLTSELVWADGERLQQILWNLLTNAIKFSADGGKIEIQSEIIENDGIQFVSVKVIDHGKGIKPAFLPKLFERFSQADSSSIRVHGGLGLGLALVRDLTRLHNGSVRAESDGLGKGSTFSIRLPVKSNQANQSQGILSDESFEGGLEKPKLLGLRIMVVEDDPNTREVLCETLSSYGADIVGFGTVPLALSAFAKENLDILVSDIAMPGEDGYSLIRKIRELGPGENGNIPALALSAYASEGDVKRALSAGFNSHMAKPFDGPRLGHLLAKLVKKKK